MTMLPLPNHLERVAAAGHKVFTNGPFDMNIVVWRNPDTVPDTFGDLLTIDFMVPKIGWATHQFQVTSRPGIASLQDPKRHERGVAVLAPGQYRGVYLIDKHNDQYEALCQRNGPVRVYRDDNGDAVVDFDPAQLVGDARGINIHKAGKDSTRVGRWSAGCIVFKRELEFERFMRLARLQSSQRCWHTYTLTLMDEAL